MRAIIERARARMAVSRARFERLDPRRALPVQRAGLRQLRDRLDRSLRQRIAAHRAHLGGLERALAAVSPAHTLARGYAIVRVGEHIIRSSDEVAPGTQIRATLARGSLIGTVDETLD
jgi:exodeoxyribonuclease VII large subunit